MGVLCRECLKLLFLALRDHALLILKYEVVASDQNLILSDMGGNSMGHDIVDFGMHLLMDESFFFGCRNNRVRHGVWEMLFQAGSDPEHLIPIASLKGDNIGNDRLCLCECACLIKDDRVRLCNGFHEGTAFDGHLVAARLSHRGENGKRHRKL